MQRRVQVKSTLPEETKRLPRLLAYQVVEGIDLPLFVIVVASGTTPELIEIAFELSRKLYTLSTTDRSFSA
jgi:hypothetical protein